MGDSAASRSRGSRSARRIGELPRTAGASMVTEGLGEERWKEANKSVAQVVFMVRKFGFPFD